MKKEWKVFPAEVKEFDDKEMTITHFISTEKKDRGGDIMRADGMKIRGRPVVLMAHGYSNMGSEPIAKPIKIWKDTFKGNKGIAAKTKFYDGSHLTPPDNTGQRLYEKAKSGFMPNWSIGYIVIRKEDIRDGQDYGRDVLEWELLEYSPVGVPMNPDAQATEKGQEMPWFKFAESSEQLPVEYKSLETLEEEEKEKKYGEPCQYGDVIEDGKTIKSGELLDMEGKPYPNEHACRLEDPGKYIRIRRQNNKFGQGIHAIWGVQGGGKPIELQAIRFSKDKFTAAEARSWLKEHKYRCKLFEPASEKCEVCGKPMVIRWKEDVSGDNCEKTCDVDFEYVCEACEAKAKHTCECIECGAKVHTDEHCDKIKCPKCGGKMRRAERPGPGKDFSMEDLDSKFEKFRDDLKEIISPLVKSVGDLVQALSALPIAEKGKGREDENTSVGEGIVVFAPEETKKETVISIDPQELTRVVGETVKASLQTALKKLTGKVD